MTDLREDFDDMVSEIAKAQEASRLYVLWEDSLGKGKDRLQGRTPSGLYPQRMILYLQTKLLLITVLIY